MPSEQAVARAHRRLRLPADHRSPAAARAAVREVLLASGLTDCLDEALLLVSELSTNGVVHAGTAFDVDVAADSSGVTITVSDQKVGLVGSAPGSRPGPFFELTGRGPSNRTDDPEATLEAFAEWGEGGELEERGRGLLLVDQLATSWGTSHYATGKSVWFRLGGGEAGEDPPGPPGAAAAVARGPARSEAGFLAVPAPEPPGGERGDEDDVTPSACVWLVHVPEALRSRLTMPQLVSELLVRLCEVSGAAAGAVWLDRGDGAGERRLARHEAPTRGAAAAEAEETRAPAADARTVVVALPVMHPQRGCVVLQAAAGGASGRHWPELAALSAHRMAIGIDADRVTRDDVRRRGWIAFLAEASELLANSLDVELTLALVPQILVPRLGDWCAVHVCDAPMNQLRLAAVTSTDETRLPDLKRLLGLGGDGAEGLAERLAALVRDEATSTLGGEVEGVAVPLSARGRVLGALVVGRHADRLHGADDIAVIEDLARRASLAIDNARAHEERAQVAQDLQRALLPQALPVAPGLEFGAEYVPASTGTEVGGDFYDAVQIRRNRWLVSIGDVCGKGAAAAAVTGVVRDVVRALITDNRSLPRTLQGLNRTLLGQDNPDKHCTLAVALVTRREGEVPDGSGATERVLDVRLCLAGHDRPVLLRTDGTTEPVGEWGTAVGLFEEIEVDEVGVTLRPGDAMVFFTDGVTERRDGPQMFGTGRLRRELEVLPGYSAPAVAARVREAVLGFSAEAPRDDIAVLVLRNPD